MTYNPAQVMMGWSAKGPYLDTGSDDERGRGAQDPNPVKMSGSPAVGQQGSPVAPMLNQGNVLGAEAVRASGTGPFDQAYRQNLATYAGGQLNRPGGSLSFDPTSTGFPQQQGLLERALGGQSFSYTEPQPPPEQRTVLNWQDWLKQFREQGRFFSGGGLGLRELM
jgi:hypothetical protein